ncbi:MAG: YceI family protein [Myxococcales bacterium]|nr:YceI family protein [Myxococcales bacterium]
MRFMARIACSLLASLLALTPLASAQAPAAGGATLSVDTGQSSVTYTLVHKFHKVSGVSKQVEGKARILPDGKVQVMVQAPVESFDSGNSNRDAHMKETVGAATHKTVSIKALGEGVMIPTTFPATVEKTFKGELSFHGEKKPIDVPVRIVFESATQAKVTGEFQISLEAFKIERPSLMLVKVDDALKLEVRLIFKS